MAYIKEPLSIDCAIQCETMCSDMEVVRHRGISSYRTVKRIHQGFPPVRMQISLCNPCDRNQQECLWLARTTVLLAVQLLDVARGRLKPRIVMRSATEQVIQQLLNIRVIVEHCRTTGSRSGPDFYLNNLPALPAAVHGMVVNPTTFDACISLRIGREVHHANVVLRFVRNQWICTTLQLG